MNLINRISLTMLVVFFGFTAAFWQDTTKARQPFLTMSAAQQRQELLLKRLSDYSYIIGRDFGKFSVTNKDGSVFLNNESLMGKVVFVNFWFDGCSPCHNLFQPLNRLAEHYKNNPGFKLVSFSFDDTAMIRKNVKKYQLMYPVFHLSETLCHSLMTDKGFPSNLLLDKTGKIVDGFGVTPLLGNAHFFEENIIPKIDSLLNNKQIHH